MTCPNCGSDNIEMVSKNTDGQGYYEEEDYVCYECNCEWTWTMTKEITNQRNCID